MKEGTVLEERVSADLKYNQVEIGFEEYVGGSNLEIIYNYLKSY